jgi:hypothetical protein
MNISGRERAVIWISQLDLGDVIGPVEERSAMEWESLVFGNKAE